MKGSANLMHPHLWLTGFSMCILHCLCMCVCARERVSERVQVVLSVFRSLSVVACCSTGWTGHRKFLHLHSVRLSSPLSGGTLFSSCISVYLKNELYPMLSGLRQKLSFSPQTSDMHTNGTDEASQKFWQSYCSFCYRFQDSHL